MKLNLLLMLIILLVSQLSQAMPTNAGRPEDKSSKKKDETEQSQEQQAGHIQIKWPDKTDTFQLPDLRDGITLTKACDVTISTSVLPSSSESFSSEDLSTDDFILLFPPEMEKLDHHEPIFWVQLLFDYQPTLISCTGSSDPDLVIPSSVDQFSLLVIPVTYETTELRLKFTSNIPEDSHGLLLHASGIIRDDTVMYFDTILHSRKQPSFPIMIISRQIESGSPEAVVLVRDMNLSFRRAGFGLREKTGNWLFQTKGIPKKPDEDQTLDMLASQTDLSELDAKTKQAAKISELANSPIDGVRDKALERLQQDIFQLANELDENIKSWRSLLTHTQHTTNILPVSLQRLKILGYHVPAQYRKHLPALQVINLYETSIHHVTLLLSRFCYQVAPFFVYSNTLPSVRKWLNHNAQRLLKIAIDFQVTALQAKITLPKVMDLIQESIKKKHAPELEQNTNDLIARALAVLSTYSHLIDVEAILDKQPFSTSEQHTIETHFNEILDDTLHHMLSCLQASSSTDDIGSIIAVDLETLLRLQQNAAMLLLPAVFMKVTRILHGCHLIPDPESGKAILDTELNLSPYCEHSALVRYQSHAQNLKSESDLPDSGSIIAFFMHNIKKRMKKVCHGKSPMGMLEWQLARLTRRNFGLRQHISNWYEFDKELSTYFDYFIDTAVCRNGVEMFFQNMYANYYQKKLEEYDDKNSAYGSGDNSGENVTVEKHASDSIDQITARFEQMTYASPPESPLSPATEAMPFSFQDSDQWFRSMAIAREKTRNHDYSGAQTSYVECIENLDKSHHDYKHQLACTLVEQADALIYPWLKLLGNLEARLKQVTVFHNRISQLDLTEIQKLFLVHGSMGFLAYHSTITDLSTEERSQVNVPDHHERQRYWTALGSLRDALLIPHTDLRKAYETLSNGN